MGILQKISNLRLEDPYINFLVLKFDTVLRILNKGKSLSDQTELGLPFVYQRKLYDEKWVITEPLL